jgi:DNA repair exonuclease SbcCD ATPase subunit
VAKQGKAPAAPAKKKAARKRKPKAEKPAKPFRHLVFTDLHLDGTTLDRALAVLDRVGELAEEHDAKPVCLGDFWNLRGHWMVRHVEEVAKRVEAWRPSVFIPGNHDQVSLDGQIHGLNIIRFMEQHVVATDGVLDEETRCAYLPWREIPEEQRMLFRALSDREDWTIFAHAEVGGATTNGGHRAPGIVQIEEIERVSRACYLGHYHKRQKLGEHSWYIGSPYQQNMAERDWPHGVALITSEDTEPEFIELKGFPRYWRLDFNDEWPEGIGGDDVVELQVAPEVIGTEEFHAAVESIPAVDVRAVALRPPEESKAPDFALTLDAAIEQWATQVFEEEFAGSGDNVLPVDELTVAGREILGEIPEAHAIPPLGAKVVLESIGTRDFCALRGDLYLPLSDDEGRYKRALIQAPIRTGKTALLDAPMWCLYGETTPRKAGQAGATLRADAVIHDDAKECQVRCEFRVWNGTESQQVWITRTKKRGSGSKVEIEGIEPPDGISDQDVLVRHVVGLSHPLWRACVGLGQGAVANFATDADKRRKDLLNEAFGLEACPKAQKKAKEKRDAAVSTRERLTIVLARVSGERDTLVGQDFAAQSEAWEKRREASVEALQRASGVALAKVEQCTDLLKGEEQWLTTKAQHDAHIATMTAKLAALRPTVRIAELQRQYGAAEAEKSLAVREDNQAREHYRQMTAAGEAAACPACGQALPAGQREQHITDAEARVRTAATQLASFDSRLTNIATELDQLNEGGDAEQAAVQQTIEESRAALTQCSEAVAQFARIRANMEAAQAQQDEANRRADEEQGTKNPFEEQAREVAERIATLQIQVDEHEAAIAAAQADEWRYGVWVDGFGAKGIPVLVLRTALYDLEVAANRYLAELLAGTVYCQLSMEGDDLKILYFETTPDGTVRERQYEQLSGGQRRCVELAFAPFALSDMIFARCGVRVSLLLIDELTTHMGADEKPRACALIDRSDRDAVLVADHDVSVQGYFDTKIALSRATEPAAGQPDGYMRLEQV